MKKILLVIDSMLLTKSAVKYACYIANMTGSRLIGVFVENEPFPEMPPNMQVFDQASVGNNDNNPVWASASYGLENSIREFTTGCKSEGVTATVFLDRAVSPGELLEEARLSDLLISDATISLSDKNEEIPSRFLRHLLTNTSCPVLITPPVFEPPEEIVFCYDQSDSAIQAMKQFTLLLPYWNECKVTVLTVNKDGVLLPEEKRRLREWLCKYYSNTDFKVLAGNTDMELSAFLMRSKRPLVVMGAYGRSVVSRIFRESHADSLIQTLAFPLFIAHS
ncbi:universal stress protein [Chitinophaga polysaccharea]|uniref:universal stress protein n=1 Tax=Chitinophaga TaxID=79328 RepID=UPI001455B1D7|nr:MULTISPECIES: universal stress protein [Chitinophaga]NLR56837.1 universal stress protein [Chitinophaga polysaccharea]NLU93060.1 universal stress protein [Chitinophaga sp. Ak27]